MVRERPLRDMKLLTIVLAGVVSACMATGYQGNGGTYDGNGYHSGTSYAPTSPSATTATFINDYALTTEEKAELERLLGYVLPAGRYQIDAEYNIAREGEPPFDNLGRQATNAGGGNRSDGRAWSMHSRDASGQGSTLVDDGNGCMIMSTPSGSISTGC